MSIALYRKYRPGTFAEVRGQEHVTEPLQQALRNGRVHHAYLFSGPRGCGKTSSARILARSLNCVQGPTPDPCGECEPCTALAPTGPGSIDVIEIDAASHGGVDDARDLRERAFFAPASSRYKVYVIDEAHMVTREGFNALLKLVEEPPPHLKFVFATTEPDKVIGTIRSRTHHYPFRLLPPSLLRDLLADICAQEGIEVEPAALPLVVRAGAGSVRDSLSILDQILAGAREGRVTHGQAVGLLGYTDASLLDEVVEAFAAGDGAGVFEAVNRVVEGGHDPRRFATDLLERFRDLMVLRSVPDAGTKGLLDQPPDQLERMSAQAGRMGSAELSRAADLFHEGLIEMRGATSPRLLLELVCSRVLLPGAGADEAALLTRLERLERRMSIGGAPADTAQHRDVQPSPGGNVQRETPAAAPATSPGPTTPPGSQTSARAADPAVPATAEPENREPSTAGSEDGEEVTMTAGGESAPPAVAPHPQEGGAPPPTAASGPPTGGLDVAAVRRVWPDVLEDVKNRRRVAWMILLGDVQVAAVAERSLTLAFAKEGDRKGFTSSGCDRVLQDALEHVLGIRWEIRTATGGAGPAGGESPAAASTGGPAAAADFPEQAPSDGESGPTGFATDATARPGASDPDDPDPHAFTTHPSDPGAGTPDREAEAETESARPPGPEAQPEPAPDPGLSGMALIQRELGGEIIEEIDDS